MFNNKLWLKAGFTKKEKQNIINYLIICRVIKLKKD